MSRAPVVSALMAELTKTAHLYPRCGLSVGPPTGDVHTWADQFRDTPLYNEALEIEKDDALQDVERAKEDAARDMSYAQRAMFRVRVAELEARLAEFKYQQLGLASEAPPAEPGALIPPAPGPEGAGGPPQASPSAAPPPAPKVASSEDDEQGNLPAKGKKVLATDKAMSGTQQLGEAAGEKAAEKESAESKRYRRNAAIGGSLLVGPGAAVGAAPGHRLRATAGSLAGGIPAWGAGAALGLGAGALASKGLRLPRGSVDRELLLGGGSTLGASIGAGLGGGLGAYYGHGKVEKKEPKKEASVSAYRMIAKKASAGELGAEAQAALQGILSARTPTLTQTKVASSFSVAENESDSDARKRRLAELLHRREPTGTDGGSASPNPPRDAT